MFSLARKIALVTGAGSGIGAAIAETFAQAGANVFVADRDEAGAQKTSAKTARREMESTQIAGRMARPEEIAAALYLASDEAAMVTGSTLMIDSGWSAGKLIQQDRTTKHTKYTKGEYRIPNRRFVPTHFRVFRVFRGFSSASFRA